MKNKNLIILDLQKNLDIKLKNYDYIKIASGNLSLNNSNYLNIKKFYKKYFEIEKKKLIEILNCKIKNSNDGFFYENEIFNLRNDKEDFFNKIINILIIKNYIFNKKYKNIKLYTDNFFTSKVFKNLGVDVHYYGDYKNNLHFSLFYILKFYLKSLLVIILCKFKKNKNYNLASKDICLSLYPNFYKKNCETFFNKKKYLKINFFLTDETHMNFSFKEVVRLIFSLKIENCIYAESFIKTSDIIKLIFILPLNFYIKFFKISHKLIIDKCDFSDFYSYYLKSSLINRFKLEIYKSIPNEMAKKFKKIKRFHYFMFEYNFGFFLKRIFNFSFRNVEFIGYQHGIFSKNLMWLEIIKKSQYNYLPNKIMSLNNFSIKDYINYKTKAIVLNSKNYKSSILLKEIKNQKLFSKNILILSGTHDIREIYFQILNNYKNQTNIFYFKLHPRNQFKFIENNYMKKVNKIKNLSYSKILISQTSTLIYSFLKNGRKFKIFSYDYKYPIVSKYFHKYLEPRY